jgi:type II secretory pathway pseudopilin PulG
VELLVVIAILAILVALSAGAYQNARKSGDRAAAIAQYRQIGTAIVQYAGENNSSLPGPLSPDQGAMYDPDPGKTGQLATATGKYLGVTDETKPSLVKVFISPAYSKASSGKDPGKAVTLVMNISARGEESAIRPWGSKADPVEDPKKIFEVPATNWAFSDADQLHPAVKDSPWANKTPAQIIHGDKRLALIFDGSVQPMPENLLAGGPPSPGGPGGPPPPPPPGPPKPPPAP